VTVVIDASVALKWVLVEPDSDLAVALLDQDLIAPAFWLIEAANALWRRGQQGQITADQVTDRIVELRNAPVSSPVVDDDLLAAASLALELGHPIYDCLYLAMAIRENAVVVTADRRFRDAADRSAARAGMVRLLSEF
jgi:predicted nucleic acid-binding protein